jgi:two-component system, chemotaxis family, chemotaxis protein CheY
MKTLVVEDDFVSRRFLQMMLIHYGTCDVAVDGEEAIDAFSLALEEGRPYDLICLDIMMPKMDGQQVLKTIRKMEKEKGVLNTRETKIIMTTALDNPKSVLEAYWDGHCTSYLVKPILKEKLIDVLREYRLIE